MEWWQILWAIMALVLVGPMAYRIIKGDPQLALKSVAGWLGFALILAWVYTNTGVAEWWEAKHGGGRGVAIGVEQPPQPQTQPNQDLSRDLPERPAFPGQ
ncbi:MAG: hypothetical protein AAF684_00570 [Pseudomonadota bacterium]